MIQVKIDYLLKEEFAFLARPSCINLGVDSAEPGANRVLSSFAATRLSPPPRNPSQPYLPPNPTGKFSFSLYVPRHEHMKALRVSSEPGGIFRQACADEGM